MSGSNIRIIFNLQNWNAFVPGIVIILESATTDEGIRVNFKLKLGTFSAFLQWLFNYPA